MPTPSEKWFAEVSIGHVTVLEAAELDVIPLVCVNLPALLHILMESNSLGIPCGIEGDDHLARLESLYNLFDEIHVVLSPNIGLKAHIAELTFRSDVDGGILSQSILATTL